MVSRRRLIASLASLVLPDCLRASAGEAKYWQRADEVLRVLKALGATRGTRGLPREALCGLVLAADSLAAATHAVSIGMPADELLVLGEPLMSAPELVRLTVQRAGHRWACDGLSREAIREVLVAADRVLIERFVAESDAELASR